MLGAVDAVVTDPPYGVNLGDHGGALDGRRDHVLVKGRYASYDDTPANFIATVVPVVTAALDAAKRGLVFCAGHNAWLLPQADAIGGVYLPAACGRNKWGYASLAHCLLYGVAPELHLGARHTAHRSTETSTDVDHPCPKPLGWMLWAVNLASRSDEVVLDPFMGSGTTGVACARLGRRFIGIEIHEPYFDIACRRIEQAYRQPDLFVTASGAKNHYRGSVRVSARQMELFGGWGKNGNAHQNDLMGVTVADRDPRQDRRHDNPKVGQGPVQTTGLAQALGNLRRRPIREQSPRVPRRGQQTTRKNNSASSPLFHHGVSGRHQDGLSEGLWERQKAGVLFSWVSEHNRTGRLESRFRQAAPQSRGPLCRGEAGTSHIRDLPETTAYERPAQ